MVKTTVTDIVRGTVTTNNPLAALSKEVAEFGQLLASVATLLGTSLNHRLELKSGSAACLSIVLTVNPFLSSGLVFGRSLSSGNNVLQQLLNACTHLLIGKDHTHTKLAEVLEE